MSAIEQQKWDSLPRRKKAQSSVGPNESMIKSDGGRPGRVPAAMHQQIADNIEARKNKNQCLTTLSSRDGCSGAYYEYLDHTADVQCHAWGEDLSKAFEHMAQCMVNYMTDIALVEEDPAEAIVIEVAGHDLKSLLYNYMSEILFKFSSDCFLTARAEITSFDAAAFSITAKLHGDVFDSERHSCGTEIKAITYSNMQLHEATNRVDLFVIVDI